MDLFPFPEVRDKQDILMENVEKVVQNGESLVAHAPTGLGKTAASLTPALEYAKENDKKVFLLLQDIASTRSRLKRLER